MDLKELYIPTLLDISFETVGKLVFGIGVYKRLPEILKSLGVTAPLVVTDKGIINAGIFNKIKEPLADASSTVIVYDKVVTEPTIESMEAVKDFVREQNCDGVIGLGGGSSMDTAKIAALMKNNPGNVADYLNQRFEKPRLPLILVPTTAGTGAEMTGDIVFSIGHEKKWFSTSKALADVALVDPLLTVSMPPRVTASTGLEALSHAIEALMTTYSIQLTDVMALKAAEWVIKYVERAYTKGKDIVARYYMSLAATTAGIVNQNAPATLPHSVGYTLAHRYNLPHGISCAIPLPYCMRYNLPMCIDKFATIGSFFGITSGTKREIALRVIEKIRELIASLDIPTSLKDLGVPKELLPTLAKELIEKYPRPHNICRIDIKKAEDLYTRMWEGIL